jgi:hypothetical protein
MSQAELFFLSGRSLVHGHPQCSEGFPRTKSRGIQHLEEANSQNQQTYGVVYAPWFRIRSNLKAFKSIDEVRWGDKGQLPLVVDLYHMTKTRPVCACLYGVSMVGWKVLVWDRE